MRSLAVAPVPVAGLHPPAKPLTFESSLAVLSLDVCRLGRAPRSGQSAATQ